MISARKRVDEYIEKGIWGRDPGTLSRPRALLVRSLKFLYIAFREFTKGQITFRAMSLVYTTLLSLVPILAVSFSVLKAFGVYNQAEPLLANFLAPLGPGGEEITRKVMSFVGNMKVGVLGAIGLAMLIYTVISVIYKMEDSLNYIWKVKKARSFARRFSDYMSVLLVGPILIFSAIGLTAAIKSGSVVQKIISIGPLGSAFYLVGMLVPYITTSAAFTFTYLFIPATKVKLRSALAGGLFAGVTWEVTGWVFASFVASSAQYSAIYSGFAIIILFMMWTYISWLIFLVGGAVSFYHQYPQHLVLKKDEFVPSGRLKERLAFAVMYLIGYNFCHDKERYTLDSLAQRLRLPFEPVQNVLTLLEARGLVIAAGDVTTVYLPARDLDNIYLDEILETARSAGEDTYALGEKHFSLPEVDEIVGNMQEAVDDVLKNRSLKGLVAPNAPGGKAVARAAA